MHDEELGTGRIQMCIRDRNNAGQETDNATSGDSQTTQSENQAATQNDSSTTGTDTNAATTGTTTTQNSSASDTKNSTTNNSASDAQNSTTNNSDVYKRQLYIRPFMFATEAALGVHMANAYKFMIICCPVGAYYAAGLNPVKSLVEDELVRAVKGGTGFTKCGGNYAGSILGQVKACLLYTSRCV